VRQAMFDPKVLLLSLNYLGIVTASLGMLFFIPQIIKSLGNSSNMNVGWLTMIPYVCGGIAMVGWGLLSDRMNERRWHLIGGLHRLHIRARHCRPDNGHLVGTRRHVDRRDGILWLEGAVLGDAADVPDRHGGGRRHRVDQLPRQSRRLLRFLVCRGMKDLTGSYTGGLYGLALFGLISAFISAFFFYIPNPAASARASAAIADRVALDPIPG
jgi:ACS family tartrate transporter-like MFS transporter